MKESREIAAFNTSQGRLKPKSPKALDSPSSSWAATVAALGICKLHSLKHQKSPSTESRQDRKSLSNDLCADTL